MLHGRTRLLISLGAMTLLLQGIGCDDRSPPSAVVVEAPPEPATAPSHPTTQELISGERSTIALLGLPFELQAPAGWQVKTIDNENVLTGPTPFGAVEIGFTQRPMMQASHIDLMIAAAQKEATDDLTHRHSTNVRLLGLIRLLERRGPLRSSTTAVIEEPGQPPTVISPMMMWKITAFVPHGPESAQYELNFHNLHEDQFEADKDFLQQILDSLKYNPSTVTGR